MTQYYIAESQFPKQLAFQLGNYVLMISFSGVKMLI